MKKIFYILILILVLGNFSCKKYLQEENLSGITSTNYYTNTAGYESLVNSCYGSLRSTYNADPFLFEYGTDVTTRGDQEAVSGTLGDRQTRAIALDEYNTLAADNSGVSATFNSCYSGIQRCNTAINRGPSVPGIDLALAKKRVGEASFIRAYYYYLLVENWGRVPIVTEEISSPITHFTPSEEKDVYNLIISDLNTALSNVDETTTDFGRVTKGAARHFLALIYLTRGYKSYGSSADFTQAAQLADQVINSGTYTLLPNFADVFKPANQQNKEIIWSVQYDAKSLGLYNGAKTLGNGQNIFFGWRIWQQPGFYEGDPVYNRRIADFMPTQYVYTLFNTTKDARYDGTFLSQFYASQAATLNGKPVAKGDLRFYFPKWDQTFSAADEAALKLANPNVQVIRFDQWKQNFSNIGGAEMFPMVNKFYDPSAVLPGAQSNSYTSTRDVFIFRLAETYLIAAEAYFKLGQNNIAADRINVIRTRATLPGQNMQITASDINVDFILDERARELEGEFKRWLDLKRTHKLDRAFTNNLLTKQANPGGVIDKYYLRPIPQSAIDLDSGGYPQNPGY
ncbi:RagB/SusD family nutrient uptake outer membrane protein [Mucilaginibacter sp. cycad4]|uniref:RagB/SusD family nutrient uptake outer membrane protein n=1 Tax=Mucilaginibacter sp. cycad4 TaxID=3342096 RepID=UPI002AAA634A|nr:RagB/SusD family nutrient uptake outer membrane protein [Mucilaginibacter gossypii]WPU98425.1 RagB/SusD family nutrient uptake outer membrane protein [Mucilaginibacter gossypii]